MSIAPDLTNCLPLPIASGQIVAAVVVASLMHCQIGFDHSLPSLPSTAAKYVCTKSADKQSVASAQTTAQVGNSGGYCLDQLANRGMSCQYFKPRCFRLKESERESALAQFSVDLLLTKFVVSLFQQIQATLVNFNSTDLHLHTELVTLTFTKVKAHPHHIITMAMVHQRV